MSRAHSNILFVGTLYHSGRHLTLRKSLRRVSFGVFSSVPSVDNKCSTRFTGPKRAWMSHAVSWKMPYRMMPLVQRLHMYVAWCDAHSQLELDDKEQQRLATLMYVVSVTRTHCRRQQWRVCVLLTCLKRTALSLSWWRIRLCVCLCMWWWDHRSREVIIAWLI